MTNLYQDTIVAPATTPGTGAISIIRVSGPEAFRICDAVVQLTNGTVSEAEGYTIHYGKIYSSVKPSPSDHIVIPSEASVSHLLDEVLVSVFRAPHSYTGEDSVEISTHASSYIVSEVIRLLLTAGARFAQPGEFTRRAFLNGKMDLAQAEAVADVISSTTAASHRVAMNQLKGHFSAQLETLREELLHMASLLELELDFSEEDVEFANREELQRLVEETRTHVEKLAASFRQGNLIKNGVPVAIVGAANAGKSTLLNTLIGDDRALVSDIPGTTRDSIEELLNIDGILFRFIDTAGIRESSDTVEKMGIERTLRMLSQAEMVLGVLDLSEEGALFERHLHQILEKINFVSQKCILVLNKVDLVGLETINKIVMTINRFVTDIDNKPTVIQISAKRQKGINELKSALRQAQNDLISNADATFVTNARHFEALQQAAEALKNVSTSLTRNIPTDLVAEDLRSSLSSINSILGKDLGLDPETILNRIFQSHCIGK